MDLTLADFVLFLLLGTSGLVVVFTMISRILHQRSEAQSLSRRVICRLCLHAFETEERGNTVDCPHCGAANERGRSRRLG
jgi:predicted RNA-binding Zn-ribbon protein involved in translation (DUF1610 family)